MKAVQYTHYSDQFDDIEISEIPIPSPGPKQVLVKVYCAGANAMDLYLYYGIFKNSSWFIRFPFTPGYEFSGIVEAVGEDVKKFVPGDEVFGVNWGEGRQDPRNSDPIASAFAEYLVISSEQISHKPRSVSFTVAASVSMGGTVALQCIKDIGYVNPESRILILGGATFIGTLAIQLAIMNKAACIVTTCSQEGKKHIQSILRQLDISDEEANIIYIDHEHDHWYNHPSVSNLDFILDIIGDQSTLHRLKESDHMFSVGAAFVTLNNPKVGVVPQAHPPFSYARFYCFNHSTKDQDYIMELVESKKLIIPIAKEFNMTHSSVVDLFYMLQSRKHKGKLVLDVDSHFSKK